MLLFFLFAYPDGLPLERLADASGVARARVEVARARKGTRCLGDVFAARKQKFLKSSRGMQQRRRTASARSRGDATPDWRRLHTLLHRSPYFVTAEIKSRRFRYQTLPPPSSDAAAPVLTESVFARFDSALDRIAGSLAEIRSNLDRVAAALDQLPLGLVFTEPLRNCATSTPQPRHVAVAPAPPATIEPDGVQQFLALLFS